MGHSYEVALRARERLYVIHQLQKVFAKILLFDRHAVEEWGPGGFPRETFLRQRPLERQKRPFCKAE